MVLVTLVATDSGIAIVGSDLVKRANAPRVELEERISEAVWKRVRLEILSGSDCGVAGRPRRESS